MNEYLIIAIVAAIAWAIIRFQLLDIIRGTKEVTPEDIMINVCPICTSMRITTTTEKTKTGINFKCKDCKYIGEMLEMNLVQAKRYQEMK